MLLLENESKVISYPKLWLGAMRPTDGFDLSLGFRSSRRFLHWHYPIHLPTSMAVGNLVVSSKASPFPYAAVAVATYTQKAEIIYDESAKGLTFTSEGTTVTTEEDAVRALAKAGGLAEDSVKVRTTNSWEI